MGLSFGPFVSMSRRLQGKPASCRRGTMLPNQMRPGCMRSHVPGGESGCRSRGSHSSLLVVPVECRVLVGRIEATKLARGLVLQPCCPPAKRSTSNPDGDCYCPNERKELVQSGQNQRPARWGLCGSRSLGEEGPKRVSRRGSRYRFDWMAVVDGRFKVDLASRPKVQLHGPQEAAMHLPG